MADIEETMTEKQEDYITEAMDLLKGVSRQIEASSSGFTPTPDVLVKKYGISCATVWGKVWRYCQMDDEVCRAAQERLASELAISRNTLNKYLTILERDGYIRDRTPDLRNKPHIYTDTGKLRLKISLFMAESTAQNLSSDTSKFEHEESTTNGNLFAIYEANMGPLTPMIADSLDDFEKTYTTGWVEEAIGLAVRRNARNLAYVETILKRWQAEGKDDGKEKPKEDAMTAALREQGYDV